MNREEAAQIVLAIGENWNVQLSEVAMELWYNVALANTNVADSGTILFKLAETMTRCPKPADWNNARREYLRPDGEIGQRRAEDARDRGLPEPEMSKEERAENVRKLRFIVAGIAKKRTDIDHKKPRRRDYR